MGAGVDHAVVRVGVGKIVARFPAVKGKLHDLHARIAAGSQHGLDLWGQVSQILCNDAALTQGLVDGIDESTIRPLFPVAACRRLVSGRDGVVALKTTEVVDAHDIINGSSVLHPALPPGEILGLVAGPVVERIAPELTVCRKGIRGAACHLRQVGLAVGLEKLRPRPQIAGIRADVDGDISHQLDSLAVGIGFQGVPLGVEEELHRLEIIHLPGQTLPGSGYGSGLAGAQVIRPVTQACLSLFGLDGHEQGVIVQPEALCRAEVFVLHAGCSQQTVSGFLQHHRALLVEHAVVHRSNRNLSGNLISGQIALLVQDTEIDKVGVPGKGGKALVGAVTVAGGANGQDLPIGLLCTGQKIHERKGFFPQRADAKGPRQTKNGHQNAACSHGELLLNP